MSNQYTIIMNDRRCPSRPHTSGARRTFREVPAAIAAAQRELRAVRYPIDSTASVLRVKSNGQHGETMATIKLTDLI